MSTDISEESAKKPRKRRTKAEIEAAQLAELNKPIDPRVWLMLSGGLLFVAACIFFDPIGFANSGQSNGEGMWIRDVLAIMVGVIGKNPTALVLAIPGVLAGAWGVRSWWQQRQS